MKILLIDGYNMFHKSRYGYTKGEYGTVYTFFRSFRALVEQMSPDKVVVALEGRPKFRYELYAEYKSNRKISNEQVDKLESYKQFKAQKDIIVDILSKLPIDLAYSQDYEADDVIGDLVINKYKNDECIVVTGDTDFIQLFDKRSDVKIYNPIKKDWVSPTSYNYVEWKSLVGDTSDNIKGISRVGPKTAEKILAKGSDYLNKWLNEDVDRKRVFERNKLLISFASINEGDIVSLSEDVDFEEVRCAFEVMKFDSMTNDNAWLRFVDTFSKLK